LYSIEKLIEEITTWLKTGEIDPAILADEFKFISPFWLGNNKTEFLNKFQNSSQYKETSLSKIMHFDPVIPFKSLDGRYFSIILQYHTTNEQSVYEAVLGKINEQGLLIELRSIYDLSATKNALQLM
jgi:hypothetical protein